MNSETKNNVIIAVVVVVIIIIMSCIKVSNISQENEIKRSGAPAATK